MDFQDGLDGWVAMELFYSGCVRALEGHPCPDCHNPWLWDFGDGDSDEERKKLEMECDRLKTIGTKFDGIVLVGGEPLDQNPDDVLKDIAVIRERFGEIPVFLYSGYDDVPKEHILLKHIQFLKIGSYNPKIPPRKGNVLASGNQRVYRVENGHVASKVPFPETA